MKLRIYSIRYFCYSVVLILSLSIMVTASPKIFKGLQATMNVATIKFEEHFSAECTQCCALAGDMDLSGGVDIADLTYTVDFMFNNGPLPLCNSNADVNTDCSIDIADLTFRVNFMFKGGPFPKCSCCADGP